MQPRAACARPRLTTFRKSACIRGVGARWRAICSRAESRRRACVWEKTKTREKHARRCSRGAAKGAAKRHAQWRCEGAYREWAFPPERGQRMQRRREGSDRFLLGNRAFTVYRHIAARAAGAPATPCGRRRRSSLRRLGAAGRGGARRRFPRRRRALSFAALVSLLASDAAAPLREAAGGGGAHAEGHGGRRSWIELAEIAAQHASCRCTCAFGRRHVDERDLRAAASLRAARRTRCSAPLIDRDQRETCSVRRPLRAARAPTRSSRSVHAAHLDAAAARESLATTTSPAVDTYTAMPVA